MGYHRLEHNLLVIEKGRLQFCYIYELPTRYVRTNPTKKTQKYAAVLLHLRHRSITILLHTWVTTRRTLCKNVYKFLKKEKKICGCSFILQAQNTCNRRKSIIHLPSWAEVLARLAHARVKRVGSSLVWTRNNNRQHRHPLWMLGKRFDYRDS